MRVLITVVVMMLSFNVWAQKFPLTPGFYKFKVKYLVDGKPFNLMDEMKKQRPNMSAAEQKMMQDMMKTQKADVSSLGSAEDCFYKEDLTYEKLVEAYTDDGECDLKFTKKNAKEMQANVICEGKVTSKIKMNFVNSGKFTSVIEGEINGIKNSKIETEGVRVSAKCPAGSRSKED